MRCRSIAGLSPALNSPVHKTLLSSIQRRAHQSWGGASLLPHMRGLNSLISIAFIDRCCLPLMIGWVTRLLVMFLDNVSRETAIWCNANFSRGRINTRYSASAGRNIKWYFVMNRVSTEIQRRDLPLWYCPETNFEPINWEKKQYSPFTNL